MEQSVDRGKRGPEHMFYFELRACNLGNTKVLLDWVEERKKRQTDLLKLGNTLRSLGVQRLKQVGAACFPKQMVVVIVGVSNI